MKVFFGFKFLVGFRHIVEYVDNGTAGNGYQLGEEVSTYNIGEAGWNPIVNTSSGTGDDIIYTFTATTSDNIFSVIFKISGSVLDLENNLTLTPNSVKIDVEIHDFPYTTTGSSLALWTYLNTKFKQEVRGETHEESEGFANHESEIQIGLPSDETQGFFSWVETADADGKTIDVLNTPLEDRTSSEGGLLPEEKSTRVYYSFLTTDAVDIVWDPKVGVISQQTVEAVEEFESSIIEESNTINLDESSTTDPNDSLTVSGFSDVAGFEFLAIFLSVGAIIAYRSKTK